MPRKNLVPQRDGATAGSGKREAYSRRIISIPLSELTENPDNARTHSDEQVRMISQSINRFGFVGAIAVDNRRIVMAGHGRLAAVRALGWESIPCVIVTGLTEAEKRGFGLVDNLTADAAGWDEEKYLAELARASAEIEMALMGAKAEDVEKALAQAIKESPWGGEIHTEEYVRREVGGAKQSGDFIITTDAGAAEMPTPLKWHGGKTRMLPFLLPLINGAERPYYLEPFAGGLACFFAKDPHEQEIINDLEGGIVNFWTVIQTKFPAFAKLSRERGIIAEDFLRRAQDIVINKARPKNDIEWAWAYFYGAKVAFAYDITQGLLTFREGGREQAPPSRFQAALRGVCDDVYSVRLRGAVITNRPAIAAINVLGNRSEQGGFLIYADPPYLGAHQGPYPAFTENDFAALLKALADSPARFVLSSYPHPLLDRYVKDRGWLQCRLDVFSPAKNHTAGGRDNVRKTECITINYRPSSGVEFS